MSKVDNLTTGIQQHHECVGQGEEPGRVQYLRIDVGRGGARVPQVRPATAKAHE